MVWAGPPGAVVVVVMVTSLAVVVMVVRGELSLRWRNIVRTYCITFFLSKWNHYFKVTIPYLYDLCSNVILRNHDH